jgi:hypothetical protein
VLHAHVLEHADAGDAVELAAHVAVVLQADLDRSCSPACATRSRASSNWFSDSVTPTQRAPNCCAARITSAPQPQPMSSRRLARLQADLAQDVVDLLELGGGQVFVAVLEIGAGIHHGRVEEGAVELVGDVVVVADRLGVLLARVRRDCAARWRANAPACRGLGQRVADGIMSAARPSISSAPST